MSKVNLDNKTILVTGAAGFTTLPTWQDALNLSHKDQNWLGLKDAFKF